MRIFENNGLEKANLKLKFIKKENLKFQLTTRNMNAKFDLA